MTAKDWVFPLRKAGAAAATVRLVVFPYAAAGATSLRALLTGLPDSVELLGVSLPGRERRFGEEPLVDPAGPLAGVSSELASREPLPTYLLGHSMGASLALLLARTAPVSLNVHGVVISGRKPDGIALEPILALTDEEILGLVTAIGHTSPQLLNDKYWRDRLVHLFRSDTEMDVRASRLLGRRGLDQPILALGGDADPYVDAADLSGWAARTTASSAVRIFPGDHFFILAPGNRDVIADALARFTGADSVLAAGPLPAGLGPALVRLPAPERRSRMPTVTAAIDKNSSFQPSALAGDAARPWLSALPGLLRASAFDEDAAARAVRAKSPAELLSNPALAACFADWPLGGPRSPAGSVLTELFLLNRTVEIAAVRRALPGQLLEACSALGLLTEEGSSCQAAVSITPYRGRYYLSDRIFANPEQFRVDAGAPADAVMPPHLSSLWALQGIGGFRGRVLDVGCGSGFLALNMPAGCTRVTGIDINPRCVHYARANRALGSVAAEFKVADFAELGGTDADRYDRFVFNAPTLPRIDAEIAEPGHTTARAVLRTAVSIAHRTLTPGGEAHVIVAAEVPAALGTLPAAVRHWLADLDVRDVAVHEFSTRYMTITEQDLAAGRLPGGSLLVRSSAEGKRLLHALAARGVSSVRTARVTLRVS